MPKVVMICRLFHPHVGGVEKHVRKLSAELIKKGFEIVVITEKYSQALQDKEQVEGIQVYRINAGSKRAVWAEMKRLHNIIMQSDVVHIHDTFWWFLPLIIKKKYFITFHGYEGNNSPRWQAVIHRKVAEFLSGGSMCIGDFMRKWYWASPTMVSYGAAEIDSPALKGADAVYWGRLDEDAGIMMYAKALPLLKQRIELEVFGDGAQKEQLIQLHNPHIQVFDWTTDLHFILQNCRYAFVSRYLSILEAMQAKRLVVAVYNNQIKKDYLTCHPMAHAMIIAGSSKELADKVNAISPENENVMIEQAFEWARKQTWHKLTQDYIGLWHRK